MLVFLVVQVLAVSGRVAYSFRLVMFEQDMNIPHYHRRQENRQQREYENKAVCSFIQQYF